MAVVGPNVHKKKGRLWILRTSYVLRGLRLRAFSDSLQSCHPSSFRCSSRYDFSSSRAPRCTLEIIALRHQLAVVNRSRRARPRFTSADRILWAWLSHVWRGWRSAVHNVKPETVIAWHRRGFCLFWTWKSRHRTGRPTVPPDVRAVIRELSTANPRWGAPRIHGELLKLGIAVSQSTVAKYMQRHLRPPSQTWRSFLTNHAARSWPPTSSSCDRHLPAALRTRDPRARPSSNRPRGGHRASHGGLNRTAAAQRLFAA